MTEPTRTLLPIQPAQPAKRVDAPPRAGDENKTPLWSDEQGFSFADLIDIINPLQHIPVVSALYRAVTGDDIAIGPRMIGGAVLGGPLGAITAAVTAAIKEVSGHDLAGHAAAAIEEIGGPAQAPTAAQRASANDALLAEAGDIDDPPRTDPPAPDAMPGPLLAMADTDEHLIAEAGYTDLPAGGAVFPAPASPARPPQAPAAATTDHPPVTPARPQMAMANTDALLAEMGDIDPPPAPNQAPIQPPFPGIAQPAPLLAAYEAAPRPTQPKPAPPQQDHGVDPGHLALAMRAALERYGHLAQAETSHGAKLSISH